MRVLALTLVAGLAAGCVATRYSPRLDSDLTVVARRFVESRSVTIAPTESERDASEHCANLVRTVNDPEGSITVLKNHLLNWPGRGFQCFEPMLYVLTLGVIPSDCRDDYEFEAVIDDAEGQTPVKLNYTVTTIQGWVAGPLSLLPGWEFGLVPQPRECIRVFNTAINGVSDSRAPK